MGGLRWLGDRRDLEDRRFDVPAVPGADGGGWAHLMFMPPATRGPFTFPAPYGTAAIRLTDPANAPEGCVPRNYPDCSVINNHQGEAAFFVVIGRRGLNPILLRVDKSSHAVEAVGEIGSGEAEGWYFSDTRPHALYKCEGPYLLRVDVVTGETEVVFKLDAKYGTSLWQPHSSADDQVHSATVRDADWRDVGCVVYARGLQSFFAKRAGYDECQIDKSGRYLVIKDSDDPERPGVNNRLVDLESGAVERTILDRDGAVGHSDCGDGTLIGEDDSGDRWALVRWDLRAPASGRRYLLRGPAEWGSGMGHNAVRGERVLVSRPDELIVVSTDGSQEVLRVAPSLLVPRAGVGEPYDWQVKASWDPLGEWACWLINREGTNALDACLVRVPASTDEPPIVNRPEPGGETVTPLDTLTALRAQLPATNLGDARLAGLMNAVAWIHRAEGYGLLRKPSGAHGPQPQTGIFVSRDILMLKDGQIFDCLIDSDGKAEPTWGPKDPISDLSRWVAPVDANVALPPQPPTPQTGGGAVPNTNVIPYHESYAISFGVACNEVYKETTADVDPGMIAVQATRAAWDYYVGGLSWPDALKKHVNEFRAVYGLPPR